VAKPWQNRGKPHQFGLGVTPLAFDGFPVHLLQRASRFIWSFICEKRRGAMANEGKVEEGVREVSEALRINPEFVDARNNLGIVLAKQGKIGEATAQFSQVIRVKPSNAEEHNNMGILLVNQGRLGEAIAQFSEAVRLQPDFAAARDNLKPAFANQRDETRPTR
jgi:tetratricopeptide (TPR) repeat protein